MISNYYLFEFKQIIKLKQNIKLKFIIHEHHAERARLHYDIRLEKDKILKSWATRKLPELLTNNLPRIQLFQTPDHPLDWLDFGIKKEDKNKNEDKYIISDGYGKGKVFIYDSGFYKEKEWSKDKITVEFFGKKIKGLYTIIPYQINYLMIKHKN